MLPTSEKRFPDTCSYHTDISFFRKYLSVGASRPAPERPLSPVAPVIAALGRPVCLVRPVFGGAASGVSAETIFSVELFHSQSVKKFRAKKIFQDH
jgi:hypothetical protein